MFGWFAKKAENTQREEAVRFIDSLRGIDQDGLDSIAALAWFWAQKYSETGIDLYEMESWLPQRLMFPVELGRSIKVLQRDRSASGVGLHVWLHSARALMYPELRIYGREIWGHLAKASPEATSLAIQFYQQAGMRFGETDPGRVPTGLEPLNR
ncbi:hypothetical protein [Devosia sediminis]|uniref:Uncharacterized protein n=1 Tax=Devosia sediminis TaxID=2798801 RepID=A0A934IWP9_9HYPH|nr:hypothetical protein [Devosia sediminis]MBJ3784496.1 hypothetical protein [Devosia sediminis]